MATIIITDRIGATHITDPIMDTVVSDTTATLIVIVTGINLQNSQSGWLESNFGPAFFPGANSTRISPDFISLD